MRVIYVAEFAVDVDAASKTMAIHEAGKLWPEIQDAVQTVGADVAIKSIRVGKDGQKTGEVEA